MRIIKNPKLATIILLTMSMLVIPIASLEGRIPRASYDIIYGDEIVGSESIEITRSSHDPVSSVLLLNDSILSEQSDWHLRQYISFNRTYYSKQIIVPVLNVTQVIFRATGYVVTGPVSIRMGYYQYPYHENTTGQTGEYFEIVQYATPDDYYNEGLIWIFVDIDGLDWSVIDKLYFSVQVEFSVSRCPVIVDLQRTNGESMYNLQEFTATDRTRPIIKFGGHSSYLCQVNDTIYLPNGNYSVAIVWDSYTPSFGDISIANESLFIAIRIKSVRLDVEATQRIPGLVVNMGTDWYLDYRSFLLKDSPSFYLPSGTMQIIEVIGEPEFSHSPYHFMVDMDLGENRNITLVVHENWILIGGVAFTPGRLTILIASIIVIVLTLVVSRKRIGTSSVFLPFILLFFGSILPSYQRTVLEDYPLTLPVYSQYTETQWIWLSVDISTSSIDNGIAAVTNSNLSTSQILFPLLLLAFLGMILEHVREEIDPDFPDFMVFVPLLGHLLYQWAYIINVFMHQWEYAMSIGLGPFLTTSALLLWYIQFRRRGGKFIQTTRTTQH